MQEMYIIPKDQVPGDHSSNIVQQFILFNDSYNFSPADHFKINMKK